MKKFILLLLIQVISINLIALDFSASESLSLRLSGGLFKGTSNEIIYRNSVSDQQLSELIWEHDINLIGVGVSYKPNDIIRLNLDLYLNMNEGNGTMTDYDWMDFGISDWTHWSHHSTQTSILLGDFNADLLTFAVDNISVYLTLGYKYDYLGAEAYGGDLIYSSAYDTIAVGGDSSSGFRDVKGSIDDSVLGITYKQYYSSPYLGLGAVYEDSLYSIGARVIYSSMVEVEAEDIHHLRDLYSDFSAEGSLLGFDINASYRIIDSFAITASYEYEKYTLERAFLTQSYAGAGTSFSGTGAGMKHSSSLISLGIEVYL